MPKDQTHRKRLVRRLLEERGHQLRPTTDAVHDETSKGRAPLSFGQEGLWFLERLGDQQAHYGIPGCVRLRGGVSSEALERSIALAISRHDSLRATFRESDGKVLQDLPQHTEWSLLQVDLGHEKSARDREELATQMARDEALFPFDLVRGPLLRGTLLRLDADDHVLLLNVHHMVADGWSMGILWREIISGYRSIVTGAAPEIAPPATQFADFARWQRQRIEGEVGKQLLDYWRRRLTELPPPLELTERTRPTQPSFRGSHEPVNLGLDLSRQLRGVARQLGCSLFVLLLAAFKTVLHAYTGRRDIVVGSTFSNRVRTEFESVVGHFANTLPVRSEIQPTGTFADLAGELTRTVLEAQTHQELPFPVLVKHCGGRRDPALHPVFQVVFDFLTPDLNPAVLGYGLSSRVQEDLQLPGLVVSPMDIDNGISRFDLAVFLWDSPHELAGSVEYSTELFDKEFVQRMVEDLRRILRRAGDQPLIKLAAVAAEIGKSTDSEGLVDLQQRRDLMRQHLQGARRRHVDD